MKGILFKPDMIKAIVEGRKTQTRRLGGLKEINKEPDKWTAVMLKDQAHFWGMIPDDFTVVRPCYQVGETVYIKEAWCESYYGKPICYKLDGGESPGPKGFWRSPMFLSAENARYFIAITDVRAERLWEVTEEDAQREGVISPKHKGSWCSFVWAFKDLWNTINKPPYDWQSNPWVWVYSFKLALEP